MNAVAHLHLRLLGYFVLMRAAGFSLSPEPAAVALLYHAAIAVRRHVFAGARVAGFATVCSAARGPAESTACCVCERARNGS